MLRVVVITARCCRDQFISGALQCDHPDAFGLPPADSKLAEPYPADVAVPCRHEALVDRLGPTAVHHLHTCQCAPCTHSPSVKQSIGQGVTNTSPQTQANGWVGRWCSV